MERTQLPRKHKKHPSSVVPRKLLLTAILACWAAALPAQPTMAAIQNVEDAHQSYTAGSYTEDQLHTYGTAVTENVDPDASYAGIGSTVVGVEYRGYEYPMLGSTMVIQDGINTSESTVTVSMQWRTRTDIEIDARDYPGAPGGMQWPPMAYDAYAGVSDVVKLTGVVGPYVMELDYDESAIVIDDPPLTSEKENHLAQGNWLYLGWFEDEAHKHLGNLTDQQEWINAVHGNSATGSKAVANYQGGFADFTAEYTDFMLSDYLGSYGVDTTNNKVWAVLDHNSEFGTIPEPMTAVLLGLGAFMLRRKRL